MIGGSHPPAAQSLTAFLFRFFGSTGVKMFLILTLALLPLGLIALVASLQAIETADLEKEALLRVAVSQSARKLTADLESDRTALQLTVNNLAATPSDTSICDRLNLFLAKNDRDGGRYAIYDRPGRTLCASHPDLAPIVPSLAMPTRDATLFHCAPGVSCAGSGWTTAPGGSAGADAGAGPSVWALAPAVNSNSATRGIRIM